MSQTPHRPNRSRRLSVEIMAGGGVVETDIARCLGIARSTLRRHYRTELDIGHLRANAAVVQNLYRMATGTGREAVTAAIFWLKTRAGWSEFSPAPASRPLGKKAQAEADAETAGEGTEWSRLVH
jgi:hypothetical protein